MAPGRLGHLFPRLPERPGLVKRRQRLSDTIETLTFEFARHTNGHNDDLLVVDSTPVECGRSATLLTTATAPAIRGSSGASRLHGLFALDGTHGALALTSPRLGERNVALDMLARVQRTGPLTVVGDKG